jgi:hypothetical protein
MTHIGRLPVWYPAPNVRSLYPDREVPRPMSTPIPSHDTVPARLLHAPYEVAPSEQIARIARLRPGFDSIEQLASLSWGGSTRAFAEQGVLPLLHRSPAARLGPCGDGDLPVRAGDRAWNCEHHRTAIAADAGAE